MNHIFKLVLAIIALSVFSAAAEVAVIVHPSNDAKIKRSDVKKLFLGKTTIFKNGNTAIPLNLKDSPTTRRYFNNKLLNRSHGQVAAIWSKLEFTGTGTPPEEKNVSEVLQMIANNPDMIGYIDPSAVTSDVKVILTIK